MTNLLWLEAEERYLRRLRSTCDTLEIYYLELYKQYRAIQGKFRLPAIILSSISGVVSFGTSTFPPAAHQWVAIAVGGVNILIAFLNTVEAYMKIGDILSKSLTAHTALKKLSDEITCELSVPVEDRQTSGIVFLRDCYTRYQQIMDQSPPVEERRGLMSFSNYLKRRAKFGSSVSLVQSPSIPIEPIDPETPSTGMRRIIVDDRKL